MDRASQEVKNDFLKIINVVKDYYLFIPILIYMVGFVFIQGAFANLNQSSFLILAKYLQIVPMSQEIYIVNGILISFKLLLSAIIGYIFWIAVQSIAIWVTSRIDTSKKSILEKIGGLLIYFGILSSMFIYAYFLLRWDYKNDWLFIAYFAFFIFWCFVGFAFINQKHQNIGKGEYAPIKLSFNRWLYFVLIALIFFESIVSIYMYGAYAQMQKEAKYEKDQGGYTRARVTIDNETKSYLLIDISKDLFVGYSGSKTVVIPMNKIDDIQTWNARNAGDFQKSEKSNSSDKEMSPINQVVAHSYEYSYRKDSLDAEKFIALLTKNCYMRQLNSMSPQVFREYDLATTDFKSFIDYEMSVPQKVSENTYKVYVIEVWKNKTDFNTFELVKQNGTWKINQIDTNKDTFRLKS